MKGIPVIHFPEECAGLHVPQQPIIQFKECGPDMKRYDDYRRALANDKEKREMMARWRALAKILSEDK